VDTLEIAPHVIAQLERMMTPDAEALTDDRPPHPRRMTISLGLAPNLQEVFGGSPRTPRTHSERFQEGLHGSRR